MPEQRSGTAPNTRSKLDPYWPEIAELRKGGCTLAGLREALASKSVQVSVSRLCTYIHDREATAHGRAQKIPAVQEGVPPRDTDEDPQAILLLRQIQAQAARAGSSRLRNRNAP